ncbi:hypothetical protein fugu_000715 [Takifugu bimaculatus]|uniref:Uncharacterized protein n=1 Tax=Takifugu bimaculatus TaxID=433685 RepID=A0A4Z2CHH8_9TELE|nr:hypothetical protein fugu_000715 [Takifugu bimaculatus]
MAASILRFGRRAPLKCFQSENWILQRNPSVAWFCSHPPEPPKVPKTPAGKTVAPGERATLLAYRTAVVFPVKASESPGFPVHSAGAAAAGSDVAASAEPRADASPTESTTSKPAEAAAAPPEPEEPLDPSTYKNYQHHSYHPFTFADMDVEMAKYRLPQPTANRH